MRLGAALVTVTVVWLCAATAAGEHDVSSRYTVLGYVKDANGRPVAGQTVGVVRNKTGLAYTTQTEETGLFVVILRLGDESAGESLTIEIGSARNQVTARFDPRNQVDERGTRVDLEGTRWLERPAWFRSTLTRMLAPPAR